MKNKELILQMLQAHRSELNRYGVVSVGLFGSYVRNEQNKNSDIDLLLDFEPSAENFDNYLHVCTLLEQVFIGDKIEIVTKNGLSPYIGPSILNEVVYA